MNLMYVRCIHNTTVSWKRLKDSSNKKEIFIHKSRRLIQSFLWAVYRATPSCLRAYVSDLFHLSISNDFTLILLFLPSLKPGTSTPVHLSLHIAANIITYDRRSLTWVSGSFGGSCLPLVCLVTDYSPHKPPPPLNQGRQKFQDNNQNLLSATTPLWRPPLPHFFLFCWPP